MASIYDLPEWTYEGYIAYDLFVEDLQDINIYVEDANSEIFYEELFKGLINSKISLKKILPLNGRENVIKYCKDYVGEKPAIFIIDADLFWVRGDELEKLPRLYQHNKYCIENYLFSENALIEIIFETIAKKTKEEIKATLHWDDVVKHIEDTLVNLFIEFAIMNKFERSTKTVKTGIKDLFASPKHDEYHIDIEKVEELIKSKKLEVLIKNCFSHYTERSKEYRQIEEYVITNVSNISNKIDIVSGKHFLIPMLYRMMKKYTKGAQMTMDSFKLRLARNCDKKTLLPLKIAIESTADGNIYQI